MPRYKNLRCVSELPEGILCGHEMTPLEERHPAFGPNWKPGCWVFRCNYCAAIRAIETEKVERYAERN